MSSVFNNKIQEGEPTQSFWRTLPRPLIGLAPMDGITDHPFRHIQKKYGNPAIMYTEFTSVEALCYGDWQSMNHLLYDESQRPIIAQIYGRAPLYFRQIAVLLCELGFDGIDINMGCPAKSVANGGCGAGLIRTPDRAQEIIQAVQDGIQDWQNGATVASCPNISRTFIPYTETWHEHLPAAYRQRRPIPVSVKTRIGYDSPVVDAWIPRLLEMEPAAITLHGRTLRQAYSGRADWDQISRAAELAKGANTLILGNGDVASLADAESRADTYGVDGILIGRASMGKPFLFRKDEPVQEEIEKTNYGPDLSHIALEHAYLYEQTFRTYAHYRFLPMRKHLAWYIRDVRGANHLRASLVQTRSPQEAEALLLQHKTLSNGVYQSGAADKMTPTTEQRSPVL